MATRDQWRAAQRRKRMAKLVQDNLDYCPETGVITPKPGSPARVFLHTDGYQRVAIAKEAFQAHRAAWVLMHGQWPQGEIDHINGDKADNRAANIREATRAQNMQNRPSPARGANPYKGVSFNPANGMWRARIRANGRQEHAGYYTTPEAARDAYNRAAKRLHRKFANVSAGTHDEQSSG